MSEVNRHGSNLLVRRNGLGRSFGHLAIRRDWGQLMKTTNGFIAEFGKYVCNGDSISCHVDGFDVRATLHYDDTVDAPDERDDGFWPSNDPNAAGYVLPENFEAEQAKAEHIMHAWNRDDWHYYGVAVTVSKNDIELTGKYAHAVWGIEGNYPGGDNRYFLDVAIELLPEAIADARQTLKKLCAEEGE